MGRGHVFKCCKARVMEGERKLEPCPEATTLQPDNKGVRPSYGVHKFGMPRAGNWRRLSYTIGKMKLWQRGNKASSGHCGGTLVHHRPRRTTNTTSTTMADWITRKLNDLPQD